MTIDQVQAAYSARADEYIEAVGKIEHAAMQDRDYVRAWAHGIDGRVVDVGCGPGQWTNHLRQEGVDIEGVDPTAAFIERAQQHYPSVPYRVGWAEDLGVPDASLGGILAWYSLIHTAPESIDVPLAEFARCVRPGGGLLVGFFDGAAREPFDHTVTTAYYWSVDALAERIERAGFTVTEAQTRADPGVRPHGAIVALR